MTTKTDHVDVSKCTPGPWKWWNPDGDAADCLRGPDLATVLAGEWYNDGTAGIGWDNPNDAALIAEAGTIAHENGLSPRQLAEQRAELLEALKRTLSWLTSYPGGGTMGKDGPYEQARAAIANASPCVEGAGW